MTIKAHRGPSTSYFYGEDSYRVRLHPSGSTGPEAYEVSLNFTIPAGGRGHSDLSVRIGSEDFISLAQAMMDVDPDAAIKAFGMAMVTGRQVSPNDGTI